MNSLVWLRTDLRIDDNPALKNACKNSKSVEAIYIFSEDQIRRKSRRRISKKEHK